MLNAQIVNIPDVEFKNKLVNHDPVIDINGNGEIEVSEAIAAGTVDVSGTSSNPGLISDLTGIEAFTNLFEFDFSYNQVQDVDLNSNTTLLDLIGNNNLITQVNIDSNLSLRSLSISDNPLTTIDISNNSQLLFFQCLFCGLTSLDTSANTNLEFLYVSGNNLSSLDLSNNGALLILRIEDNQIDSLDIGNSTLLDFLFCQNNSLETLDLSNNTSLRRIECGDNMNLTYVNLQNGNNGQIFISGSQSSNFENLPALETVCIDDVNSSLASFILAQVNHSVTFIENCLLGVTDNSFNEVRLFPNPTRGIVNFESLTPIIEINVYGLNGQLLFSEDTNIGIEKINLDSLTTGIYFIEMNGSNAEKVVKKIIKE